MAQHTRAFACTCAPLPPPYPHATTHPVSTVPTFLENLTPPCPHRACQLSAVGLAPFCPGPPLSFLREPNLDRGHLIGVLILAMMRRPPAQTQGLGPLALQAAILSCLVCVIGV